MKHSKIFTRADGSKVQIEVNLITSWSSSVAEWGISVHTCAPKKRSWYGIYSGDDYDYRRLDANGRADYILERQMKHCTAAEVLEVKLELWNKIKPTI
jgi:hypothetical protein